MSQLTALMVTAHAGPGIAVTTLVGLLSLSLGPPPAGTFVAIVVAVGSGQAVVGWTNDLLDAPRDRVVERTDKPLATGAVETSTVRRCVAVAGAICVASSLACGVVPGLVHLLAGVGSALAYNLVLKSTPMSWLPYTVAFGSLPVVVSLTVVDAMPAGWMIAVGALLGFGAHLLNVLPDLADDAATDVHGLAHRLPERMIAPIAAGTLLLASIIGVVGSNILGRGGALTVLGGAALVAVVALALLATVTRGRTPFAAAVAIAVVDALVLVIAG